MLGDLIPYCVRDVLILWESWVKASKNHGNVLRDNPKQSLDNNLISDRENHKLWSKLPKIMIENEPNIWKNRGHVYKHDQEWRIEPQMRTSAWFGMKTWLRPSVDGKDLHKTWPLWWVKSKHEPSAGIMKPRRGLVKYGSHHPFVNSKKPWLNRGWNMMKLHLWDHRMGGVELFNIEGWKHMFF